MLVGTYFTLSAQGGHMAIKVLIADDTDLMRQAMRKVIETESRIQIVGETSTFGQTMQAIADLKPEVLLLDLHLPEKRDFAPAFVINRATQHSAMNCVFASRRHCSE
jgi:DNA-binding NarL/FixJ family response regulator